MRSRAGPNPSSVWASCKEWLSRALPALLEAEAAAPLEGSQPLHLDVRSDNIRLLADRVVFVDWNNACLGNGPFDVAS